MNVGINLNFLHMAKLNLCEKDQQRDRERLTQRDREEKRQTDREETDRLSIFLSICLFIYLYVYICFDI